MRQFYKKLVLLCFLVCGTILTTFAQLDTKHYIPPMYGRSQVDQHWLLLSTPETTPFNVTVTDGAGNLITTASISVNNSFVYDLGIGYAAIGPVEASELNTVNTKDALILTADRPFFANVRHQITAQGMSLTAKGNVAEGTRFRSGHVISNTSDGAFPKAHFISVMATRDTATVTISDITAGVTFLGLPQTGGTTDDVVVTLNPGESYVIGADLFRDVDGVALQPGEQNEVNGTLITSDKKIVVNSGSWVAGNEGAGVDIGVDQIVPIQFIGTEYIVMQGNATTNADDLERPLVVADVNNTQVFVNGSTTPIATLSAGEYFYIPFSEYSANGNMYITTSEPAYLYQSTSANNTNGPGLNFIPPLNCNGLTEVQIGDADLFGTSSLNILAEVGTNVQVNGTALTNSLPVTGNSEWVSYRVDNVVDEVNITADNVINVALVTVEGARGAAGYFSGFNPAPVIGAFSTQVCNGGADLYVVNDDSYDTFQWLINGFPIPGATGSTFTATGEGVYSVVGEKADCGIFESNGIPVLDVCFEICDNGIDDDEDGLVDCEDPDCSLIPPCNPNIPTLSEWGLYFLFLLFLNFGVVATLPKTALATANKQGRVFSSGQFSFPLIPALLAKAVLWSLLIMVAAYVVILFGWGTITMTDFICSWLCFPLLVYLTHLLLFARKV